jgi:hypothetical protein
LIDACKLNIIEVKSKEKYKTKIAENFIEITLESSRTFFKDYNFLSNSRSLWHLSKNLITSKKT